MTEERAVRSVGEKDVGAALQGARRLGDKRKYLAPVQQHVDLFFV